MKHDAAQPGGRPAKAHSFNVSQTALEETTKCPHEFACLKTGRCGDCKMCEVVYAVVRNTVLLATREPLPSCAYRVSFRQEAEFCLCPVRFGIYKQYEK